jgi:hypothetical protein
MRSAWFFLTAAVISWICAPALAVEGPSAAGPIGGTDVRSAQLPPPGFYGGAFASAATALDFVDGNGNTIPALSEASLTRKNLAPFFLYVPNFQVLGGSVGLAAFVPFSELCGRLFAGSQKLCRAGVGDFYAELDWSRSFATPRASRFPGAFPILEGLTVALGFGMVVPTGQFNASDATSQALSAGSNIYDFAPCLALTYTTPPIIVEGTEFSAKLYWNNYLTNPVTQYFTGSLVNIDFAVSEHIGRFQVGAAGTYAVQVADDKLFGDSIPPDGRRGKLLSLGGVLTYDMPEHNAAMKIKVVDSIIAANTVRARAAVISVIKKFP